MEEVQETVARLRFWRQGLRSPELTGEDPATLKELSAFVDQFGKGVRRFWEQAVKTRRIRKSDLLRSPSVQGRTKGSRVLGKVKNEDCPKPDLEEREIEVPSELRSQYSRCISILDRVNQQLIKIQTVSAEVRKSAQKVQGGFSKIVADDNFWFFPFLTTT